MKNLLFVLFTISLFSCTKDVVNIEAPKNYEIWSGPSIEFKKEPGTDPNIEKNQDSITPSVAITRGIKGEIYNAFKESESKRSFSPLGTKWSIGNIDNLETLEFKTFRTAVGSPKSVVGKKLVLHIEEENIILSVEFTSWNSGGGGSDGGGSGFSYIRSTKN